MNFYSQNIRFLSQKHANIALSGLSPDYRVHPTTDDLVVLSKAYGVSIDTLITKDLEGTSSYDFSRIKFLVLDVDGVLTDGGMYYTESGDEFKKFNTKDGMGIKESVKKGLTAALISSGINRNLIQRRADLLGIKYVYVGKDAKLPFLEEWCKELNIGLEQVAYIGDDINDLAIIGKVGLSACPSDAIDEIKASVSLILTKKGGEGCVREFLDMFMRYDQP